MASERASAGGSARPGRAARPVRPGRITIRRRGGGHKRRYRIIDFKRNKFEIPGKVATIGIISELYSAGWGIGGTIGVVCLTVDVLSDFIADL